MRISTYLAMASILSAMTIEDRSLAQASSETFDLKADKIEVADNTQQVTFTGNVRGQQGSMIIETNAATANYSGKMLSAGSKLQLNRIVARGAVKVTRPTETATGNYGIYDLNKRVLIMLGNVTLRRPGSFVNGARLTLDLDTNRAVMNGSPVSGEEENSSIKRSVGRVTGSFTVPKRKSPAQDSSPTQP